MWSHVEGNVEDKLCRVLAFRLPTDHHTVSVELRLVKQARAVVTFMIDSR